MDVLAYNGTGDGPGIPNILIVAGSAVLSVPDETLPG